MPALVYALSMAASLPEFRVGIRGPESGEHHEAVAAVGARFHNLRCRAHLLPNFRIVEDDESGVHHHKESCHNDQICRAVLVKVTPPCPEGARGIDVVLDEVCEHGHEKGELQGVRQDHGRVGEGYAHEGAQEHRPTSAPDEERDRQRRGADRIEDPHATPQRIMRFSSGRTLDGGLLRPTTSARWCRTRGSTTALHTKERVPLIWAMLARHRDHTA